MEDYKVRQTGPEVQEALDQTTMNKNAIATINGKLPEAASPENPLTDKAYVDGKVSEEKTRAEGAEGNLQNAISTEAQARQQADGVLDGKIGAEKTRAEGAESALRTAIGNEAQARQQADGVLDGKIGAEKTRAEGAEGALQELIQQVSAALANYYLKTETYSKAEVNTIVDAIKQFRYEVAAELPTASAATMGIIYLIPSTNPKTQNVKDEFITVLDGSTYKWEQIGSTTVDLSGYSTTAEMNAAIASALTAYYTKTQVDAMVTTINAAIASLQTKLENGEVVPALAGNLESWAEDVSEVSNSWDETVRSTAGDDPIDTAFGGILTDIVAKDDFKCDALKTSGYNLLRLADNGGVAVAVGDGWYFPVPHLELGAFGDATKNNGVLLTDKDGNNINNATVRFKALADGVPTSVNDGVAATYQDVTYNDETFRTYLTSGEGYLIVSGITFADTCAHLAWEDWYDKYVSPTAEDDTGDSINLAPIFAAAPNGTGKFLVVGSGGNMVATRATRTSATQMTITDPVGRVTSPSWKNELQEDEETYKHSLTISDIKADGLAQIEGSAQVLTVEGTTVSYTDANATAISGAVRYEKATPATATATLAKTQYNLNDCGIEIKSGAVGEAYFGCTYSQNVADALSQIAKVKLDISLSVVAEALLYLYNENKALRNLLAGKDNAVLPMVKAQTVFCDDLMTLDVPNVLYSSTAGAPSAAVTPDNWNEETMTVWNGCPRKVGQQYVDQASGKVYYATKVTGSTADWVVLN